MVVWKSDWKSLLLVPNVRDLYGPPSHVTTIWIPDAQTVQYSDESGIQVFGIQMVAVILNTVEIWIAKIIITEPIKLIKVGYSSHVLKKTKFIVQMVEIMQPII